MDAGQVRSSHVRSRHVRCVGILIPSIHPTAHLLLARQGRAVLRLHVLQHLIEVLVVGVVCTRIHSSQHRPDPTPTIIPSTTTPPNPPDALTHLLEEGEALGLARRLRLGRLVLGLLLGDAREAGGERLELVAHAGVPLQARLPEVQALPLVVHAHLRLGWSGLG